MSAARLRPYLCNCGWLLVPALLWNAALADKLPPAFSSAQFWHAIPTSLAMVENGLRVVVFAGPFFMPLRLDSPAKRRAALWFIGGTLIYFATWLALIVAPEAGWSRSALGFFAPAYTPLIWLAGLAKLGTQVYGWPAYRWWYYLLLSMAFIVAHLAHVALVYTRTQ